MQEEKKYKQIAGVFLLLMFAVYYADVSFFSHCHTINGVTIVHSHFHSAKHEQSGTHSASELTLISTLSSFDSPVITFFCLAIFLRAIIAIFKGINLSKKLSSSYEDCISLRAPPVF